jgi:hypothetical protein
VVASAAPTPSDSVLELRSGTARVADAPGGARHWLCSVCGHQWTVAEDLEPRMSEPATAQAASMRAAREQRGRSLAEVSVGTGIQERHLLALERGAPIDEFPAPAYARFFLREYAEYLRLDPAPLLREFDARHAPVEETPLEPPPTPPRPPRPGWSLLAALSIVTLLLIAVLPSALRSDESSSPPSITPSAPPSPAHDSGRVPFTMPPAREPTGVLAVLRLTGESWVRAIADGEIVEASTLAPGTVVRYRASEVLEIRLGNAGGVRLRVGGELVPTGSSWSVVDLTFRWEDGAVRTDEA